MKSAWFKYVYCGNVRFGQKNYERSLKNEIDDQLFLKVNHADDSFEKLEADMQNHIKQENILKALAEEKRTFRNDWSNTLQQRKVSRFERFSSQVEEGVMTNILEFLALSDLASLLSVCKAIHKKVRIEMKELELEAQLKKNPLASILNQESGILKSLYRSCKYELLSSKILGTQMLFSSKSLDMKFYTLHLLDYVSIKNLHTRNILKTFVGNNLPNTLMLSKDPESNNLTLWAVRKQNGDLKPFVIKIFKCSSQEQVISAKFCSEKYLIVQTLEKESDIQKKKIQHRIYIKKVRLEVEEVSKNTSPDHCLTLINEDLTMPVQLTSPTDKGEIEYKGILPNEFSFVMQDNRMIYFYSLRALQAAVFSYNLKTRECGFFHVFAIEEQLLGIIAPSKSEKLSRIFVFLEGSESKIFEYCDAEKSLSIKRMNLFHNGIIDSQTLRARPYQYGSFDKLKMEYIVAFSSGDFYLINMQTTMQVKVLSNCRRGKVLSWNIYQDQLAIIYEGYDLCLYKLPLAEILSLQENQQAKLIVEKCIYFSSHLGNSPFRPIIYLNDSHIILVNLLGNAFNFHMLFVSPASLAYQDGPQNKFWLIKESSGAMGQNLALFLRNLEDQNFSSEIIKFEDDKLLFKFDKMRLFFDLKSNFNYNPNRENLAMAEKEEFQINLNDQLSILDRDKPQQSKPESKCKSVENAFLVLTPNKNLSLEKEKDVFEIGEEDLAKTKSQLRKKLYSNIKKKIFRFAQYENFVINAFHLRTIPSHRQKEWILKQMKRRKTNKKNTFDRKFRDNV